MKYLAIFLGMGIGVFGYLINAHPSYALILTSGGNVHVNGDINQSLSSGQFFSAINADAGPYPGIVTSIGSQSFGSGNGTEGEAWSGSGYTSLTSSLYNKSLSSYSASYFASYILDNSPQPIQCASTSNVLIGNNVSKTGVFDYVSGQRAKFCRTLPATGPAANQIIISGLTNNNYVDNMRYVTVIVEDDLRISGDIDMDPGTHLTIIVLGSSISPTNVSTTIDAAVSEIDATIISNGIVNKMGGAGTPLTVNGGIYATGGYKHQSPSATTTINYDPRILYASMRFDDSRVHGLAEALVDTWVEEAP